MTDVKEKKPKLSEEFVEKQCSICGVKYIGWGNNAAPFPGRCCNDCNAEFVIPARMKRMFIGRGW